MTIFNDISSRIEKHIFVLSTKFVFGSAEHRTTTKKQTEHNKKYTDNVLLM